MNKKYSDLTEEEKDRVHVASLSTDKLAKRFKSAESVTVAPGTEQRHKDWQTLMSGRS